VLAEVFRAHIRTRTRTPTALGESVSRRIGERSCVTPIPGGPMGYRAERMRFRHAQKARQKGNVPTLLGMAARKTFLTHISIAPDLDTCQLPDGRPPPMRRQPLVPSGSQTLLCARARGCCPVPLGLPEMKTGNEEAGSSAEVGYRNWVVVTFSLCLLGSARFSQ
jgi:hypothetical protein